MLYCLGAVMLCIVMFSFSEVLSCDVRYGVGGVTFCIVVSSFVSA